jgi:hypothetical protein
VRLVQARIGLLTTFWHKSNSAWQPVLFD